MKVSRKQEKLLQAFIQELSAEKIVSEQEAARMQQQIEVVSFDWQRLARWSIYIAIFCLVISLVSVVTDKALMALLERIFNLPHWLKSLLLLSLSAGTFWGGLQFKRKFSLRIYSLQMIYAVGCALFAGAVFFFGKAIDTGTGNFPPLIFIGAAAYLILGLFLPSVFVWVLGLIALATFFGAQTGYISSWGAYYFGMNYPLRFVLFGCVLTALSFSFLKTERFKDYFQPSFATALFYLFMALWILSIFGNYGDGEQWRQASQIELFHWSLIFAAFAIAAIWYGLRYDNSTARGFGITFLFINLYTRFFEYFWEASHKAIFFGLLGLSFWLLGRKAETIWHLKFLKDKG